MELGSILVALDGSHRSEASLRVVTVLAKACDASVVLVHAVEHPVEVEDDEVQEEVRAKGAAVARLAQEYLEGVAAMLRAQGLHVGAEVVTGRAPTAIIDLARRSGASIIALTSRGRGPVPGASLGSVATRVLTSSPVPVLVVKARRYGQFWTAPRTFRSIVVPLDGSALAEGALPWAEKLATCLSVPITLITLLPAPAVVPLGKESIVVWEAESPAQRRLEELASRYLARVSSGLAERGIEAEWRVSLGPPGSGVLYWAARCSPCLVVMTARGRSGPARWLGSVVDEVVRRSRMPILVVPAPSAPR
ncbi:MAG TPA: universal stress protein [Dehalococcoidia bacterium]|nr:universal stress protein [Dehalococcoidia bacterium]